MQTVCAVIADQLFTWVANSQLTSACPGTVQLCMCNPPECLQQTPQFQLDERKTSLVLLWSLNLQPAEEYLVFPVAILLSVNLKLSVPCECANVHQIYKGYSVRDDNIESGCRDAYECLQVDKAFLKTLTNSILVFAHVRNIENEQWKFK